MKLGAFGGIVLAVSLLVGHAIASGAKPGASDTVSSAYSQTSKQPAKKSGLSGVPNSSPSTNTNKATTQCDWTPLLIVPLSTPRLFRGSDGLYNLVYELQLINYNSKPSKISSFEIHNARGGLIRSYSPAALHANMLNLTATKVTKATKDGDFIPPGGTATLWINLEFKDKESAPKELQHKIAIETEFAGKVRKFENGWSKLSVEEKPPVVVGPPLRGGRWFASGGYAGKAGHRKALFPLGNTLVNAQRYAIDWLLMTDDDHAFKGEGKVCSHFAGYGKQLIAAADGTVVGVIDRYEDQIPGEPKGEQIAFYPGGNSVVIDIGDGNYAFYAHMKPGSVKVKEGQKVKRGDHIGDLGSSGNSSAPHLHFHVMAGPSILGSPGVPYVFDSFIVNGITADENKAEKALEDGGVAPIVKSKFDGKHTEELPREGMLIVFPE
ncbi:MAG: M23 family metallopeptidase [Candidatus Melainabacteria bacterium]|nr:M23 family metallopeptidase [Candidatus Melainabacteria bacterium]